MRCFSRRRWPSSSTQSATLAETVIGGLALVDEKVVEEHGDAARQLAAAALKAARQDEDSAVEGETSLRIYELLILPNASKPPPEPDPGVEPPTESGEPAPGDTGS